jgi:hypothetical protein
MIGQRSVVSGGHWSVIGQWCVVGWSGVSSIGWGDNLGNWGNSRSDGLNGSWLTVDNSVETVDWIGGVVDGSQGSIGFDKAVLSSDNISVAGFVLVLVVSGDGIMDSVAEAVLWVWIVWFRGDGLDNLGHWGVIGQRSSIGWGTVGTDDLWGVATWVELGRSDGDESGEHNELELDGKIYGALVINPNW